jgi:hypothetical protein
MGESVARAEERESRGGEQNRADKRRGEERRGDWIR